MNKDIYLSIVSDLNGKILEIGYYTNVISEKIKDQLINTRIFNLIHHDYVITFITDFKYFLTSKNQIKFVDVIMKLNNNLYNATFEFEKKDNLILINIYKNLLIMPYKKKILQTIFFITRFKFVIGSLIPFLFAVAWTFYKYQNISYYLCCLLLIGLIFFHIAANTFNDYFDWISGRDIKNTDYVLLSSGGSRAIDFNLISENKMYIISLICTLIVFVIGVYLSIIIGYKIFILGLFAFICVYFYSAPPVHLASRYGAGELVHIICLGPMITYGTVLTLTSNGNIINFIIGLPFGILITCCLLMNEYPDSKSDKLSMKNNLAVVLTKKYIPVVFTFLVCLSLFLIFYFIKLNELPKISYLVFIVLPYLYTSFKNVFAIRLNDDNAIAKACLCSFNLYMYISLTLILSIIFASL